MPFPASTTLRAILLSFSLLCACGPVLAVDEGGEPGRDAPAVIGGSVAPAGRQPWMAALVRRAENSSQASTRQTCGGVLIAPAWVLTAAHCLNGHKPDSLHVIIGRNDLNASGGEVLSPVEFIKHPLYGSAPAHDIALIRLERASAAVPIPLARTIDETRLASEELDLYGWGYQSYRSLYECEVDAAASVKNPEDFACRTLLRSSGTKPSELMEGRGRIHSHQACDARLRDYRRSRDLPLSSHPYFSDERTPGVLCIWDEEDIHSACYGDSGGPLVAQIGGRAVAVGVASYGTAAECKSKGQISAYTSVAHFRNFIDEAMLRDEALGFANLCPGKVVPIVGYFPQEDGTTRVRLSWPAQRAASGYRIFYSPFENPGMIGKADVTDLELAVFLKPGQKFRVAVQARSAACDGPMSNLLTVSVP